jgi:hypothetical protein
LVLWRWSGILHMIVSIALNLLLAALAFSASAHASGAPVVPAPVNASNVVSNQIVEVWVVLSEPALASLPPDAKEERAALRERVVKQQNVVMTQLAALGATESGRIQHTSTAIAVSVPAALIESVKKIDGVIAVRLVNQRNQVDAR